ncbi:MAG: hypothetical protein KKI18_02900 [Planctomycetes bacterium]|nr:hypothetical protein [Planctomycetota bacterium]MBU1517850.1 hypothetical protein [Planctomycetota bacterium]
MQIFLSPYWSEKPETNLQALITCLLDVFSISAGIHFETKEIPFKGDAATAKRTKLAIRKPPVKPRISPPAASAVL